MVFSPGHLAAQEEEALAPLWDHETEQGQGPRRTGTEPGRELGWAPTPHTSVDVDSYPTLVHLISRERFHWGNTGTAYPGCRSPWRPLPCPLLVLTGTFGPWNCHAQGTE